MTVRQDKSVRVFFALWPDAAERNALAAWQPSLHQLYGGRAMQADTLHATLVFLGDVIPQRMEDLRQAAREVDGAAFELVFDRALYWAHNRIVYAESTEVPQALAQLVSRLEQCLDKYCFKFDRRTFRPHVTLLRHAGACGMPLPLMPSVTWRCRHFVLVQSVRDEAGAHYRELARFPLRVA
jgi:2'-5' RNA ligase